MTEPKQYIGTDGEVTELDAAWFADAKPTSDVPILAQFARKGRPALPPDQRKQRVTILLDADLVETLRASGKGWQTRVNSMLRQTVKP
jgi:uncharacterized protein (DUF4415 family)